MIALDNPPWLKQIQPWNIPYERFPLDTILQRSVFCPCSGFDGDLVRYLAGNFHSFIFVSHGSGLPDKSRKHGFNGYDVLAMREITERELVPKGWALGHSLPDDDRLKHRKLMQKPFCTWMVFERRADRPLTHGPCRFSVLYLCADVVAAYDALYVANRESAAAIAVLQAGGSPGRNSTDLTDRQKIFARTVMENPAGTPRFLLFGGNGKHESYGEPCWDDYADHICFLDCTGGGTLGVWRLAPNRRFNYATNPC
jgi:hypothetical protein